MSQERRRRTRVAVNFTATFRTERGKEIAMETHNISMNGMLVKSDRALEPGTKGDVILRLSPAVEIKIKGKVVRTTGDELAIGFLAIDEDGFPHLKRMVALNKGDADLIDEELKKAGFNMEGTK